MDISSSTIARLAGLHLRRYRARLKQARAGALGYCKEELEQLVATWDSILRKGCKWSSLSESEQLEVSDAIQDELEERE